MISRKIINQVEGAAKKYFNGSTSGCHDWTHIERVKNLALRIGKKEKAKLEIIEISALLHDIHKHDELKSKGKFCHAEQGAKTAKKLLRKYGLDTEKIKEVAHCIISHRTRNNHSPLSIEAKSLHDADKLDAIGAVGVARDFVVAGFIKSPLLYTGREKKIAKQKKIYDYTKEDSAILEYEKKLKYIKDKILTKEGKRIARDRHKFMENYFKRFWEEVRGAK